jgi:signal transduction histidine kinase
MQIERTGWAIRARSGITQEELLPMAPYRVASRTEGAQEKLYDTDTDTGPAGSRAVAVIVWCTWILTAGLSTLAAFMPTNGDFGPGVYLPLAAYSIAFATVGSLLASRRPGNPIGWLLCALGLWQALSSFASQYAYYALITRPGLPAGEAVGWISSWIFPPLVGMLVFLLLLFPNGRLPSRRWQSLAWLAVAVPVAEAVSTALLPGMIEGLGDIENPFGIQRRGELLGLIRDTTQALGVIIVLGAVVSLFLRLHRASGEERQQLKWIFYAGGLLVSAGLLNAALEFFGNEQSGWIGFVPLMAGLFAVPLAIGVAVLRHHLYDIDLIINRTLVYGTLIACVVGIYVLVVGYLGALFRTEDNLLISVAAAGLVAVLFAPLKERLQRGVDRLTYGDRKDPYGALSRLGERLEGSLSPEAVLPTVVGTVREALKLPYAAIAVQGEQGERSTVAESGLSAGEKLRLPLVHRGESVGELLLAPRLGEKSFSTADRRLLDDLARQAGAVAHAVRLTHDLRRSRERLVATREEERRRLRRDLHDGLGPMLGSLTLKLDVAGDLVERDPARTRELLHSLKDQAQEAVTDVRRLVHALRPPALDELGLVGALREQAARYEHGGLAISVEAPELPEELPAAVEVAAYRIAQEAITNVARHSAASQCTVHLDLEEETSILRLEVTDDGRGLPDERRPGVGLASMRERATELGGCCLVEWVPGGGTRVWARVPLGGAEGREANILSPEDRG